ncbi:MAG: phage protein Gp36 family protein [Planctomycetota bacterium]
MAYITKEQLSERLGATLYARLTDRVQGATANDSVGQELVEAAEAEANSYLARRYATPVDVGAHPEVLTVLRARVLDVAEYLAWKGSPFVSDPPQRVHALYAGALRWLEQVAAGQVALPAAAPPAGSTGQPDGPRYVATPRRFTAEELEGL